MSTFRTFTVNLPALQQAVENVTATRRSNRKCTPATAASSNDAIPLALKPDIIPDVKLTITPKPAGTEVKTSSKGRDKDLTLTISSSDVKICKPQVARRGKPLSGPNRQQDRVTLVEMKKINSPKQNLKIVAGK